MSQDNSLTVPAHAWQSHAAKWGLRLAVPGAIGAMALFLNPPASAVPAFADQTGQPCQACHVGGFGPELTPFGREFKLGGYTMRAHASIPLAVMAQGSFNHTARNQDPGSLPSGYEANDNFALDQVSLFVAGGAGQHFGGFAQVTYDGVGKQFTWDDLDLRAVTTGHVLGSDAVFGLSLNNNPTVQDAWNTTPAWGYPYYAPDALNPAPGVTPLIDGALGSEVLGLTAYAWIDHQFYVEAGAYSTPAAGTLRWLGADPMGGPGDIHGLAPYGRVAWQHELAGGTGEVGAFALKAAFNPQRDRTSGYTDHYTDLGLDASWQKPLASGDTVSVNLHYIHEASNLQASCQLGLIGVGGSPACADTKLDEVQGTLGYSWHNKIGANISGFSVTGSRNTDLYVDNANNSPDSNGLITQLDYTPWSAGNSPLGIRANMRVGLQYTAYGKYNGTSTGAGGNNTLRIFTWLAF